MLNETVLILLAASLASADIVDGWDNPGPRRTRPGPIVRTSQGLIRGEVELYDIFRSHISYKGIPYGQGRCLIVFFFFLITKLCFISAGW